MKINIIQPHSPRNSFICASRGSSTAGNLSLTTAYDSVSFKRSKRKDEITDLRQIPGITCACCGDKTIQNSTIDKLLHNEIYYPADEAIKILSKAGYFKRKCMTKSESKAYEFCKTYSKLYKGQYINDIFDRDVVASRINAFDKETQQNIRKIEKMTSNIYHNSEYMIKALEPYKEVMHKTEREVFELLKEESLKYPEKTFTDILSDSGIQELNLIQLEEKQNLVFDEVEKIAKKMSPTSCFIILENIDRSKTLFYTHSLFSSNKRTAVIDSFKNLEEFIPENELMLEILSKIYQLPSSKNDANSFIIKYGNDNPNLIAERLLRGSAATYEHVKPRKREGDNGENNISNYIVLCANCNSERAQIPYSEFMKFHPDMPKNLQKYLNLVIEYINNGILIGFDKYPDQIKKAVEDESDKKIKLSFTALNLLEALKNRNSKKSFYQGL